MCHSMFAVSFCLPIYWYLSRFEAKSAFYRISSPQSPHLFLFHFLLLLKPHLLHFAISTSQLFCVLIKQLPFLHPSNKRHTRKSGLSQGRRLNWRLRLSDISSLRQRRCLECTIKSCIILFDESLLPFFGFFILLLCL